MTKVEQRFEQLSPLLDDAVLFIAQSDLTGYESAALASLATSRISMGCVLSILRSEKRDDDVSQEERNRISELLLRNSVEADDIMCSAARIFASGERVQ